MATLAPQADREPTLWRKPFPRRSYERLVIAQEGALEAATALATAAAAATKPTEKTAVEATEREATEHTTAATEGDGDGDGDGDGGGGGGGAPSSGRGEEHFLPRRARGALRTFVAEVVAATSTVTAEGDDGDEDELDRLVSAPLLALPHRTKGLLRGYLNHFLVVSLSSAAAATNGAGELEEGQRQPPEKPRRHHNLDSEVSWMTIGFLCSQLADQFQDMGEALRDVRAIEAPLFG